MKKEILLFVFTALFALVLRSQEPDAQPIVLTNPSFEGLPNQGNKTFNLNGWQDCGDPDQTPPDIHPVSGGSFRVTQKPVDGNTYLGMVIRKNDTWERVTQRLSSPLLAGTCYEFTISLCRSMAYDSPQSSFEDDTTKVPFTTPAKLRIWGGTGFCNKLELLAESQLITSYRWLGHDLRFEPKQTHNFIVFEAYYDSNTPFRYNGNVLLDNASAIIPVPCIVEKPVVADLPKPKILQELDRSKLKQGQTIRIDQLYFKADSSKIEPTSLPVLDELYNFLSTNSDVIVEIGGHTNGIPPDDYCDRLSTARAKAVADFLAEKGIPRDRLQYKGYGKRLPVETNKTEFGRKRNQRVEVKILSFNG